MYWVIDISTANQLWFELLSSVCATAICCPELLLIYIFIVTVRILTVIGKQKDNLHSHRKSPSLIFIGKSATYSIIISLSYMAELSRGSFLAMFSGATRCRELSHVQPPRMPRDPTINQRQDLAGSDERSRAGIPEPPTGYRTPSRGNQHKSPTLLWTHCWAVLVLLLITGWLSDGKHNNNRMVNLLFCVP